MEKKMNIANLPRFDITEHLTDDAAIAEYLSIMAEDDDPAMFLVALGDVARARGMTQVAKEAGIGRESLYKALRADSQPQHETIKRVCHALGFRIQFVPTH